MGVVNCLEKENKQKENNNQIIFINDNQSEKSDKSDKSDLGTNDEKVNKLLYASNIQKSHFKKIKCNFKNSMKNQAEFIDDKSFEDILERTEINKIDFPNEIENTKEQNSFIAPPIKFSNGQIYKGSWNINNQRHGFGININPDGLIYKGLWNNDKIGHYGLFLESNGNYLKGELKDGKLEGKGEMEIKGKYKYIGDFKHDLPNGKGYLEDYVNKYTYDGDIVDGIKDGKGILEYIDNTKYEGDFKEDLYDGEGILKFNDGKIYEGEFKGGKIKGAGKFKWQDGKIYEGEYNNNMKNGNGKFFWNENKYYDGQWVNNKQHGRGKIYYNGEEIEGIFRFGKIIKEKSNK